MGVGVAVGAGVAVSVGVSMNAGNCVGVTEGEGGVGEFVCVIGGGIIGAGLRVSVGGAVSVAFPAIVGNVSVFVSPHPIRKLTRNNKTVILLSISPLYGRTPRLRNVIESQRP